MGALSRDCRRGLICKLMEIIKIDQVSIAARAGALDADLAYSASFTAHRDLVSQTAASGLQGLQTLLNDTGYYGAAITRLQEVSSDIELANIEAAKDPFQAASSSLRNQHQDAAVNGLRNQAWPYYGTAGNIKYNAQNAVYGTTAGSAERGYADRVLQTAAELELGTAYLINQADPGMSRYHTSNALNNAYGVRGEAQSLWNSLNAQSPKPTARLNALQAVINSANDVINHATNVLNFLNTAPIAIIRTKEPQVHDLGGGYSLATWGDSGYTTLTDASGAGILIRPDGTTDTLNGGSQGWKFNNTSTFVLPNLTKVTFTPGSPASILLDRGIHTFTITGIQGGSYPSVSSYTELNGRDVDLTSNDGHIIQLDGNANTWSNNGNRLGDNPYQREVIAQNAITNKLKLDPTDVSISSDLTTFLGQIGIKPTDYDSDGKLNNVELSEVAVYITSYLEQMQAAYETAMQNVVKANQALEELNEMLDTLRREASNRSDARSSENAEASAALKNIEKRLVAALQLLQGTGETQPSPLPGGIEASAERVLSQLTEVTQQGGLKNVTSSVVTPPGTGTRSDVSGQTGTTPSTQTDALGDSLRRASRLLSGLLGGGNLNILDLPPQTQTQGSTPESSPVIGDVTSTTGQTSDSIPGLDQLATALASLAVQLDPGSSVNLSAPDLSAGMQVFLTVLADAGVLDLQALQSQAGQEDLLKSLSSLLGSNASSETSPSQSIQPSTNGMVAFLGALSELGSALKTLPSQTEGGTASLPDLTAVARQLRAILSGTEPNSGTNITSQPTGELAQLSRVAEQLRLVLAGAAALGSAGGSQSTSTQGSTSPSPAELRLGLQSLLAALLSLESMNPGAPREQKVLPSGSGGISFQVNTQSISTISGNFFTDPELMKQLQANLNKAIQVQNDQLSRASTLFTQSQKIVQTFVNLIKQDDLVRDVVKSDDLSDEQQALFDNRMTELRKDWGVDWGGDDSHTPASQSQLAAKAMQSGMMV